MTEFKYNKIEGYCNSLGCTVRECIDCGCLVPGGPTRCNRCADWSAVKDKSWIKRLIWKFHLKW